MTTPLRVVLAALLLVAARPVPAQPALAPGARVWLDAHNCYPDGEHGTDRLARALAAAAGRPVSIEQDLVWDAARQASVVSHATELDGTEPTLEDHFFRAVAPLLDRAVAAGPSPDWPLLVLHLDFKTNEAEHHAEVWRLLGRHSRWLTTAPRVPDAAGVQALTPGPLLVLTENGDGQERDFFERVPVGETLRLFGTVPGPAAPEGLAADARLDAAIAAPPETLIPSGRTNYRRWSNHPWAVVERGGQPHAAGWTTQDRARLDALVARAHALGLWIRFYTLNGHGANGEGWSDGYNFGSLDAVRPRWTASIDAGVDFIATDQYDALAAAIAEHAAAPKPRR